MRLLDLVAGSQDALSRREGLVVAQVSLAAAGGRVPASTRRDALELARRLDARLDRPRHVAETERRLGSSVGAHLPDR